jgi:uncharacterized protein (DUF58 family)
MTATADFGSSALAMVARIAAFTLLAIGAGLALMFAFAAALVVGLMILGAAIAMQLTPKRASAGDGLLEARRTPTGWVVETAARPKV